MVGSTILPLTKPYWWAIKWPLTYFYSFFVYLIAISHRVMTHLIGPDFVQVKANVFNSLTGEYDPHQNHTQHKQRFINYALKN